MQSDLYDDQPANPPQDAPKPDAAADEKREQQDDQQTGMLPKAFFGGKDLTPGTECMVRIEQVLDDEVAISYIPHSSEKSDDSKEVPPPTSSPDTENTMYQ